MSTISLLSIAPELRDQILEDVLFLPEREPPENPSSSLNRRKRQYRADGLCCDGHDIWVDPNAFLPAEAHPAPILLVNRQLYHEASHILAKRKARYRLDVMYVKDCGLWPTWLSVPRMAHHADSVHVAFRVFDPPPEIDFDRRNHRQFFCGSGDGRGPPLVVWTFFAMLKDYLRYGPAAFEASVGRASSFTVRELILDIVPPPPGTVDDNLGFPRGSAEGAILDAFSMHKITPHWPRPPNGESHLMVGEKMAYFVASKIGRLLSMYEDYGAPLYEHVGSIDIRVDGTSRRLFDLDELMNLLPTRPITGTSPRDQARQRKRFDDWKARAWARRKAWR